MRILFLTGRELAYQRNEVLCRAFRRFSQVDVISPTKHPRSLILSSLIIFLRCLPKLLSRTYDLVFVGFYGHLMMFPVSLLARFRGIPILFDVFVSNYDTLVQDRQTISPNAPTARLAFELDKISCQLAHHLLIDTPLHIDYFVQAYPLSRNKFSSLPVGCNEDIFTPQNSPPNAGYTQLLYYCTYLPLHGAEVVVEAAEILKGENIHFHMIGMGQEYEPVKKLAKGLEKIQFTSFLPLPALRDEIARADICLGGHFGRSQKAGRVVPGKIYQILAMARPLVASDSPANLTLLTNQESALLCPPGNPQALAEAILRLHHSKDLQEKIRQEGYRVYKAKCSEAIITETLKQCVDQMLRQ